VLSTQLIGKLVDERFRVVSLIGSGAMADVYEVEHAKLGRKLALKVLRQRGQTSASVARRFTREARALSRISSEHVVSIFDYGALPDGAPFFVMELLRGQSLRALLDVEHELAVVRVCNLAIDVCLGLHASHREGLVHRDLKPENLWVTRRDDGREACILLDFGVVSLAEAHTTVDGALVGTACYMSPEQIDTDASPGPESDVFALGVVAYECLSGRSPFAADSLERTLFRVLNDEPVALPEINSAVPAELWEVISRALCKRRDERFQSALELAQALLPFTGHSRRLPPVGASGELAGSSHATLADGEGMEVAAITRSRRSRTGPRLGVSGLRLGALVGGAFAAGVGAQTLAGWWPGSAIAPEARDGHVEVRSSIEAVSGRAIAPSLIPSVAAPPLVEGSARTTETVAAPPPSARQPKLSRLVPVVIGKSAAPAASAPPSPPQPRFDGTNPYQE
jgi:serine/threonine-protein kinase